MRLILLQPTLGGSLACHPPPLVFSVSPGSPVCGQEPKEVDEDKMQVRTCVSHQNSPGLATTAERWCEWSSEAADRGGQPSACPTW